MELSHSQVGLIVFGIVFLCGLLYLISYYIRQYRAGKIYEELQAEHTAEMQVTEKPEEAEAEEAEEAVEQETTDVEPEEEPFPHRENTVGFEELATLNEDIYAWIEIPGTLVDYPILQHPTDAAYYLNHTVEREAGLPGSIYSEAVHPKDFSAVHTVLYGHNMKNNSMFGSLHDYEQEGKLDEAPYVYIYLPDRTLVYEIFAAVQFSDAYLPYYCDYEKEEDFNNFIEEIRQSPGNVNPEADISFGSKILTLSTCIADAPTSRYLVVAVLVGEYEV